MNKNISLSDGEWKLMNLLWEKSPRTIAEMVKELSTDTGWSKNTLFVMLSRMEEKGAVRYEGGARARLYYPTVLKTEIAVRETESFLKKVYDGSLGIMVASMAGQKALTKEDIDELYAVLREAEKEAGR
ncbi:MAG: BlaI/MecI/CopY family transcriptional regulator [Bacillota bacterium]|nr:BlaI/MecI/CopY family transcriptional regulator [Bacillota bacterium]